jgi:hypothetical protein
MPTWEDLLEGYVGLAKHFICTTCRNYIFRGSSGYFGQKLILNKLAPPGGLKDEAGHAITFQCINCIGKDPLVVPVVQPSGDSIKHINVSDLPDAQDKKEIIRVEGDYNARQEIAEIGKQATTKEPV